MCYILFLSAFYLVIEWGNKHHRYLYLANIFRMYGSMHVILYISKDNGFCEYVDDDYGDDDKVWWLTFSKGALFVWHVLVCIVFYCLFVLPLLPLLLLLLLLLLMAYYFIYRMSNDWIYYVHFINAHTIACSIIKTL